MSHQRHAYVVEKDDGDVVEVRAIPASEADGFVTQMNALEDMGKVEGGHYKQVSSEEALRLGRGNPGAPHAWTERKVVRCRCREDALSKYARRHKTSILALRIDLEAED